MNGLKRTASIVLGLLLMLILVVYPSMGASKVKVVTTTSNLASIAKEVGGQRVSVSALAPSTQDPHYQSARPSMVANISQADVFVKNGLKLEVGWVPELMRQARNQSIRPGGKGHIDASAGVNALDIPRGSVDRSMGDIHSTGNHHFTMDPVRTKQSAYNIVQALAKVDPDGRSYYVDRLKQYYSDVDRVVNQWKNRFETFQGHNVIVYHHQWVYLINRLGLNRIDSLEPYPGIPPSASHVNNLIQSYKDGSVRAVITAPWNDIRLSQKVADSIGARMVEPCPAVNACDGASDILSLFETNAEKLLTAFQQTS